MHCFNCGRSDVVMYVEDMCLDCHNARPKTVEEQLADITKRVKKAESENARLREALDEARIRSSELYEYIRRVAIAAHEPQD